MFPDLLNLRSTLWLAPIYSTYSRVQTTILTAPGHIALRFYRWLNPGEEAGDLEELSRKIGEALGDAVFTAHDEPLELVVGRLLRDSSTSLAIAESCTGGMIGTLVTRIPGSSEYFLGGLTCYGNAAKISLCDVPEDLIRTHGAVSAPVAEALARGVRQKFKAGVGLSVTGIAGPDGGSAEKPVGLVYVGLSGSERTVHFRRIIPGDRDCNPRTRCFLLSHLPARVLASARRKPEAMRTFIAIPIPDHCKKLLDQLQQPLRASGADVRWTSDSEYPPDSEVSGRSRPGYHSASRRAAPRRRRDTIVLLSTVARSRRISRSSQPACDLVRDRRGCRKIEAAAYGTSTRHVRRPGSLPNSGPFNPISLWDECGGKGIYTVSWIVLRSAPITRAASKPAKYVCIKAP